MMDYVSRLFMDVWIHRRVTMIQQQTQMMVHVGMQRHIIIVLAHV